MKNIVYFYWHAFFLALTKNFMDINTVVPALVMSAGGTEIHLGIITTITIGGSKFSRIFFGGWFSDKSFKKGYLLFGINIRVVSLVSIAVLLFYSGFLSEKVVLTSIFILMTIFSVIPYTDILGKSLALDERKRFFVKRQAIVSIGVLASALIVKKLITVFKYPLNYSILIFIAASLLFIASLGFWILKEKKSELPQNSDSIWSMFRQLPELLKKDKNLTNYLIVSNLVGLGIAIIPFYVSLGKENFSLSPEKVGTWLLVQIIGMILSNFLWLKLSKQHGYKPILYTFIGINMVLPILALLLAGNFYTYLFIFLISGFALGAYEIVIGGILIEISDESNRSFYTGISGAGSVLTVLYPLLAGAGIRIFGYIPIFVLTSLFATVGVVFIARLKCR